MARRCTICDHPARGALDQVLVAGEPLRTIADRWSVSKTALIRHKADHIPAQLARAEAAKEVARADSLLDRLCMLSRETAAILKEAREGDEKDNELALKAIARAEKQIELQARLLGELQETTTVNVLILPEWHQIRRTVLQALLPFPEARVAVATVLQGISNGSSRS